MCLSNEKNTLCSCFSRTQVKEEESCASSSSSSSSSSSCAVPGCNLSSKSSSVVHYSSSSVCHMREDLIFYLLSSVFNCNLYEYVTIIKCTSSRIIKIKDIICDTLYCVKYLRLLLFIISISLFINSLDGDFVHDDIPAICTNEDVIGSNSLSQLFQNDFWGMSMSSNQSHKSYRPFTILTFRWNVQLSRINGEASSSSVEEVNETLSLSLKSRKCNFNSTPFHMVNVTLHAIIVQMIFTLMRQMFLGIRSTLMISLFFAVHPIHTEAVSSIVGRADLLAGLFSLFSLQLYCRDKFILLSLTYGPVMMPLMTKEDETLIILNSFLLAYSVSRGTNQDNPSAFAESPITRLLTFWYLAAFNVYLIIFPSNLSYDWQMASIPLVTSFWDARNLLTFILICTMVAILCNTRTTIINILKCNISLLLNRKCKRHMNAIDDRENRENACLLMAVAITIIKFLPASNLFVTVGFVVAERILYLPSLGLTMLTVIGWKKLLRRLPSKYHNWLSCIFYMVIVILAMKTVHRNRVWCNRHSLFESGLRSTPSNAKVHYNYGNLQKDLGNSDVAERHYRIALSLWPRHESSLNNLATVLRDRSPNLAEKYFRQVLQINPFHAKAYFNLASMYSKRGLKSKAINLLKRSIHVDDKFAEAYSMLASLCTSFSTKSVIESKVSQSSVLNIFSTQLNQQQLTSNKSNTLGNSDWRELIVAPSCPSDISALHAKALDLSPFNSDIINDYGAFLHMTGKKESAVIQYTKALKVNPSHKIARSNLHSLLRSNDAS